MNVAWDLDDTILKTDYKTSVISIDSGAYVNPVIKDYIDTIDVIITGRHYSIRDETIELLEHFDIHPNTILMNHREVYTTDHIAKVKSNYLTDIGSDFYVEDNMNYRVIMRGYTDVPIISTLRASYILKELE